MTVDHADIEPSSTETPDAPADADTPSAPPPSAPPVDDGPGAVDAALRRGVALVSGVALIVGFFLPWRQATALDSVSVSGLDIVLKGLMEPSTRYAVLAVPLLGITLLVAGYVGRRTALFVGLLAGLTLILVGAWQTLSYLAESIGTGLWVVAGASLLALIGGIPWQRIVRGMRK